MRQLIELQGVQHIVNRRDAVNQPRVGIAAHDLLFIGIGADQIAHHRAHHIVQGDHAHHQAVFVQDHGKVLAHLLELVEHFGQGELVRHDQHAANQAAVFERQRLVVQRPLEQVFGIHVANHMVNVAIAHRVGGIGLFGNAGADDVVGVIAQKIGDAVALRHGRGHGARVHVHHIGNHLLRPQRQHPGAGAILGHGQDIVAGDALIAHGGQAENFDHRVGQPVKQPHQRF